MNFLKFVFILVFLIVSVNTNEKEDALKGVILERISQFITYNPQKTDLTICIYDDPSMYNSLQRLYKGKKYNKLPIKVLSVNNKSNYESCDVFYTSHINKLLTQKMKNITPEYTLFVCNDVEKLSDGFTLALYLEGKKIRIAINQEALLKTKLKVDYRLLKVASVIVNPVKAR